MGSFNAANFIRGNISCFKIKAGFEILFLNSWFKIAHLQDALLNELSAIYNIANDEDDADDQIGHQSGVTKVLPINVGVGVAQLQGSGGEVEVIAIVSMSKNSFLIRNCIYRVL